MAEKSIHFIPIKISSGTLEGLKWLAMLLMTIDHVNRIFFDGNGYLAYSVGRIAMPMFAFVFVYNLARPAAFSPPIYFKTFKRLIFFGLLATPAYMGMMNIHGLYPLNILFTFLVVALTLFFYEKDGMWLRAAFCFFFGSIFVEFAWIGVALCIASWWYCKKHSLSSLILCFICYLLLALGSDSNWPFLTIPIIMLATQIDIKIPRVRYFFWGYYPLHLSVLMLVKILINGI